MLEKYQEAFGKLSVKQAAIVSGALARTQKNYKSPTKIDGISVFKACESAKLDQSMVITSIAGESSPDGLAALSILTGKEITVVPEKVKKTRTKRDGVSTDFRYDDPRIITNLRPNQKRQGSASHARYNLYVEGMSINQAIAAGVARADIAWDTERGFYEAVAPDSPEGKAAAAAYAKTLK